MEIQKYSGAGNNFLIINNINGEIKEHSEKVLEIMSSALNRIYDGVIFIEESSIADFHMNYYNRDGTGNALCGNGLRCTVKYLHDNKITKKKDVLIEAVSKIYHCKKINDEEILTKFPPPTKLKLKFNMKVHFVKWWQILTVSFIDVGSPHLVVFIDDIQDPNVKSLAAIPVEEWGKNLRMHKDLMPDGANINFVDVIAKDPARIAIRSYERGVEAETLACGTGSMSSAIISFALRGVKPPVNVLTKSGAILTVNFEIKKQQLTNLSLTGPAERIKD